MLYQGILCSHLQTNDLLSCGNKSVNKCVNVMVINVSRILEFELQIAVLDHRTHVLSKITMLFSTKMCKCDIGTLH